MLCERVPSSNFGLVLSVWPEKFMRNPQISSGMKVTFLTWEFPPDIYGGAGVHVQNLVENLRGKVDLEVRTRALAIPDISEDKTTEGVKVRRYSGWHLLKTEAPFSTVLEAFATDLAMIKDPIEGDIVHGHTWYTGLSGYFAKNLYGQKLVFTVHSLEPKRPWKREALGNGYLLSSWAERTVIEACDAVIAVSKADAEDVAEYFRVDRRRIRVIPNGVDEQAFGRLEDPVALGRYGIRKPYVLFLGRLSRQKGIFDLVSIASRLSSGTMLVIVTGAADEKGLTSELAERIAPHRNIVWVNRMLPREDVVAFLSGASVFVAPSLYEPFGIMNLEAMACERPVVSTRVGGIVDVVVHDKTGLLTSPNDPEGLAEAINTLLSDPEKGERMGRAGRKRVVEQFTWRKVADQTFSLYKELLG